MNVAYARRAGAHPPAHLVKAPRDAVRYDCEEYAGVCPVAELRAALAREAALLREKDALIEAQATLSRESDHRFLNNLQMVSSLLSMQSRAAGSAEAASALAHAADRVATIGRIHRHLHSHDGVESVAFKVFLKELCRDVTGMMTSGGCAARIVSVEGVELGLPTSIGTPLGFIASELITNALKYGDGPVTVRLESNLRNACALSVENTGPPLPEGFDPAASKGFGMRIIRSFVATIGGELRIGRGGDDRGARFTVLFSPT
jgi:two-component sensor histidine kinase